MKTLKKILLTLGVGFTLTAGCYAQSQDRSLPVVYVTTENGAQVVNKEDKIAATIWIDPRESGMEALGTQESPVAFTLSGRGNYTWVGFDKKPYKLKFAKKTSVLGCPKNKTFALLAHADDDLSFLRNTVGFELSRRVGLSWTPTQIPVEYVCNGQYQGLYFLCETIKVGEGRVEITEQEDLATNPEEINGGWLVEIDNYDKDPHVEIIDGNGEKIIFTYKSPEELSEAQETYLRQQMEAINAALFDPDKSSTKWEELIDIESAARYYIVQEILDDCESYHGSCYLTRDRGADAKWKFGPVWDFGNTFQRANKNWIWNPDTFYQVWIGELYKFPRFQEKVKEIWKELTENGSLDLDNYINSFITHISSAAKSNAERWPQYGNNDLNHGVGTFKSRLQNSISWLNNDWAEGIEPRETIYIRGEFNNWSLDNPLNTTDGVHYTITLPSLYGEFKFASSDWSTVDLGANETTNIITEGEEYQLMKSKQNLKLNEEIKDCSIYLDIKNNTVVISREHSSVASIESEGMMIDGRTVKADGPIYVYDLTGSLIASGYESVELEPGIVIIVAGEKAKKAIVK